MFVTETDPTTPHVRHTAGRKYLDSCKRATSRMSPGGGEAGTGKKDEEKIARLTRSQEKTANNNTKIK